MKEVDNEQEQNVFSVAQGGDDGMYSIKSQDGISRDDVVGLVEENEVGRSQYVVVFLKEVDE